MERTSHEAATRAMTHASLQAGRPLARSEKVPPDPGAMIESMRAFGYSLPTALADLVDNSITARARNVWIDLTWAGSASTASLLDDGSGMDAPTLSNAMRLGSTSPRETRSRHDLGRFGLGLKTASFSQARSLTVASRTGPSTTEVRRWDLDFVIRTRDWSLLLDAASGSERQLDRLATMDHGTLVLLERLDRLVDETSADDEAAHRRFLEHLTRVEAHLAMVFHRFLTGPGAVTIHINERPIHPWDPFLSEQPATQPLPSETLPCGDGRIVVQPYVLPHYTKLSHEAHVGAGGPQGWNAHQGFYVYRARRLLVAGSWLGLPFKQEEHHKLARIQVDLDTSMDLAWQIDVRKATARVPGQLRDRLRAIAKTTRHRASAAYRFRGKTVARTAQDASHRFVWQRRCHRGGGVTYRVNREHPLIRGAMERAGSDRSAVERILCLTEENLPVVAITMDASDNPDHAEGRVPYGGRDSEALDMLREAHATLVASGAEPVGALQTLAGIEPFDSHPQLIAVLTEELTR